MSFISVLSQNVIRSFAVWVDQDTFMYQFHTMIILILFCITQALYETSWSVFMYIFFQFGVPVTLVTYIFGAEFLAMKSA